MTRDNGEMPDLDPRAAALLAAYRRGAAMPPEARARVRTRLQAAPPAGQVVSLTDRRQALRAWAVVLATAAAVLIVWALSAGQRLDAARGDAAVMSPSHGLDAPTTGQASTPKGRGAATDAAPRSDGADGGDRPRDDASEGASGEAPRTDDNRRTTSAARPTTRGPDAPPDEPALVDLREETEVLARGWRAVAAGDFAAAKATVDEHARRFAAGALAPERAALAAICACAGGAGDDALARAFLTDHPRSPLTRRVREACKLTP